MGVKKTLYVNLFGGPGIGKSTIAAELFSRLKWNKIDCELVREYAKDKVWEQSYNILDDQLYVSAKQYHRMFILNEKVDIVITDSPLLLGLIYDKTINLPEFNNLILKLNNRFHNLNIFLQRDKDYNPNGRLQTYDEAKEKDNEILNLLESNNIKHTKIIASKETIDTFYTIIIEEYNKMIR